MALVAACAIDDVAVQDRARKTADLGCCVHQAYHCTGARPANVQVHSEHPGLLEGDRAVGQSEEITVRS